MPYYQKTERFTAPSSPVIDALNLSDIDTSLYGTTGEFHNGFARLGQYTPLDEAWPRTYDALGHRN